jgi:hypothetical protein
MKQKVSMTLIADVYGTTMRAMAVQEVLDQSHWAWWYAMRPFRMIRATGDLLN